MIDPGKMNDRVRLQKLEVQEFFEPYYHTKNVFVDVATVWATFRPTGGREFREGAIAIGEERATFTTHYREDIRQVDRLIFQGKVWEIKSINRVGWKEGLDINCTTIGATP